jgi:hypothetical protein
MKPSFRTLLFIVISLTCSSGTGAQRGSHHVSSGTAMTGLRGPGAVVRMHAPTTQAPRVITTSLNGARSNVAFASGTSPLSVQDLLNPVPGFGFDFVHLAAVNRDLGVRALIDPVTQMQLALAERLLRETPVAPVVFPAFGGETPFFLVQQQPPVIVLQQPTAAAEASPAPATQQPTAAPAPAQAPLPDVGELILVRRDGSQVLAVAFTRQDDRIVYVTREGTRRSLAIIDLDSDATVRVNEERGTSLQLPL